MYLHCVCTCTLYVLSVNTCTLLYIHSIVYALDSVHVHVSAGRSMMKQYMPMKPVKQGFKVWVRADAVTGYFCDFDVYVGRPADGVSVETGLGERVVQKLCQPLRGEKYHIYCDNFFTSCHLFDQLLSQGIYACGTTRTNRRRYPETLKGVSLERGDQVFCQQGNLVASVWMDKKPVAMLSTLAQPDTTHIARRKQRDGSRLHVQCSDSVVLYNKYMGGWTRVTS